MKKWMDLPLVSGNKVIGFIAIDNKSRGIEFTDEDLSIMAILAGYAAQAIENAKYFKRQEILYYISKKLSTETLQNIEELQKDIVKEVCKILQTEQCSILLFDEGRKLLIRKAAYLNTKKGWTHTIDFEEKYKEDTFISGKVFTRGEPKIIDDIPGYNPKKTGIIKQYEMLLKSGEVKNAAFAPVTYKDEKIGVIRVSNKLDENNRLSEIGFKQEDLDLLISLGEQIAVAIKNSQLFRKMDHQRKGLEELNRVISMMTSAADLDEIYKAVEETKNTFKNIDEMCLLKKGEDNDYSPIFNCSTKKNSLECGKCKKQKQRCIKKDNSYDVYYCPNVENDDFFKSIRKKNLKSRFIIPLVFRYQLLGIFDIGSKNINAFSYFDQRLFKNLGSQIAIAINNRIKQEQQMEIFKDISHTLGTYLTTMRGYPQLLIEGKVKEVEKLEYLKELMGEVLSDDPAASLGQLARIKCISILFN